ncbi:MAG: DNA adenine methylase [Endozoicomonadaceae bacterium]|nr:DNA adenine methylase [Endozoicomonadaceae bacterium]
MEQAPYFHSVKSNSPFRYAGGKFYARKLILPHIPKSDIYCEPFAGGASIFFAKEHAKNSILNDLDIDVINTLIQIRDHLDELLKLLDGICATKKLHTYYKNEYIPKNNLERAFRWYYLNRTSYSGIMKHENCYWGYGKKYSMRPENWPRHLHTVSKRLQNVKLTSNDFEHCIDSMPDSAFLFVDPPYYNADQKKFYNCHFEKDDHIRLMECLKRNANRLLFLITYDNSEDIKKLYQWCNVIEEQEWQYTINRTDDQKNGKKLADGYTQKRSKGRELFVKNYDKNMLSICQPIHLPEFIQQLRLI